MSAWEYVETYIANIFALLVADNPSELVIDRSPAIRAYGVIVSFQQRKAMVDAAAEALFFIHPNPDLQARLKALMKTANGWASRRNDVAHGKVGGWNPDLNKCVLWPADYNTRKYGMNFNAAYCYNHEQIAAFERAFFDLHDELGKYLIDFWRWRAGAPPELPE